MTLRHDWVKTTLGHGTMMCSRCGITDLEAVVLGCPEVCDVHNAAILGALKWLTKDEKTRGVTMELVNILEDLNQRHGQGGDDKPFSCSGAISKERMHELFWKHRNDIISSLRKAAALED